MLLFNCAAKATSAQLRLVRKITPVPTDLRCAFYMDLSCVLIAEHHRSHKRQRVRTIPS